MWKGEKIYNWHHGYHNTWILLSSKEIYSSQKPFELADKTYASMKGKLYKIKFVTDNINTDIAKLDDSNKDHLKEIINEQKTDMLKIIQLRLN